MPITKKSSDKSTPIDPNDLIEIKCITDAMLEKRANNVISLNLTNTGTAICDHFVICDAPSTTQVSAIADNVEEQMQKACNRRVVRKQGKENAFWIILDYGNIVVHLFQKEYREFYRLETLWGDSEKIVYQD